MANPFDSPVPVIRVDEPDSDYEDNRKRDRRVWSFLVKSSNSSVECISPDRRSTIREDSLCNVTDNSEASPANDAFVLPPSEHFLLESPGSSVECFSIIGQSGIPEGNLSSSIEKSDISPTVDAFVLPLSQRRQFGTAELASVSLPSSPASGPTSPRHCGFTTITMSEASESPTEGKGMSGSRRTSCVEKPSKDLPLELSVDYRRNESLLSNSGRKIRKALMRCDVCRVIIFLGTMSVVLLLSVGMVGYFQYDSGTRKQRSVPTGVEPSKVRQPTTDYYEYILLPIDHAISDGLSVIGGMVPYNVSPVEPTPSLPPIENGKINITLKGLSMKPKDNIYKPSNLTGTVEMDNVGYSGSEKASVATKPDMPLSVRSDFVGKMPNGSTIGSRNASAALPGLESETKTFEIHHPSRSEDSHKAEDEPQLAQTNPVDSKEDLVDREESHNVNATLPSLKSETKTFEIHHPSRSEDSHKAEDEPQLVQTNPVDSKEDLVDREESRNTNATLPSLESETKTFEIYHPSRSEDSHKAEDEPQLAQTNPVDSKEDLVDREESHNVNATLPSLKSETKTFETHHMGHSKDSDKAKDEPQLAQTNPMDSKEEAISDTTLAFASTPTQSTPVELMVQQGKGEDIASDITQPE